MQVQIEPVDEHNMPWACGLFKELHGLSSLSCYPFDDHYNRALCAVRMRDPTWWVRLARNVNGDEYVGTMVGQVQMTLFSQRLIGIEHLLYVRSTTSFRGAIAMQLVRSFMRWCYDTYDCIMVQSGDIASINGEASRAIYIRCGFKNYGALYSHERGTNNAE